MLKFQESFRISCLDTVLGFFLYHRHQNVKTHSKTVRLHKMNIEMELTVQFYCDRYNSNLNYKSVFHWM